MTTGPREGNHKRDHTTHLSGSKTKCTNNLTVNGENANQTDSKRIRTDYPVVHQRGQRKYGPPSDWDSDEPPKGSELFVSKLPKDMLEDELIPVFEKIGPLFEIRLMMETPTTNKGFAFIKYCKKDDAETALCNLNEFEIRYGNHICVTKSIDNNRIFIGNIPKTFTEDTFYAQISSMTSGVVKVILYPSVNDRAKNRGYGFVQYETHQLAASARQKLMTSPVLWAGHEVKVDWAEPELTVDDEIMKKVKVLYVRNLALSTTEQQIQELFASSGHIERVRKLKDYAFVHFATREQAESAKVKFRGYLIDGCEIDICWSKPVTNKEEYQQRKAMSKAMLSGAATTPVAATINVHGEPFLLNQRIRTAAGAQGLTSRQIISKMKHCDTPLHQPTLLPTSFLTTIPMKTGTEVSLPPTIQQIFPIDRLTPGEEIIHETPIPIGNQAIPTPWITSPYLISQLPTSWTTPAAYSSSVQPQQNFISTTYFVQPQYPQQPIYDGQYTPYHCQQFYAPPLMTPVSSMNGSSMSVDRL